MLKNQLKKQYQTVSLDQKEWSTKMQIIIPSFDELNNAEDSAMAQAMYSRDASSIIDHLKKVKDSGSGKFMDQYYVGYGHASIGQCGNCQPIFIEQVSMLVAKAIQDTPLYNGQESSSRYIDWSTAEFHIPIEVATNSLIFENAYKELREFYIYALPLLKEMLKEKYPTRENEQPAQYDRAINARAFDILRGFLPAGAQTQLSWQTNLHHAHERLLMLINHPLSEVCSVAHTILNKLRQLYPHSFKPIEYYKESEEAEYIKNSLYDYFYAPVESYPDYPLIEFEILEISNKTKDFIEKLPRGLKLPPNLNALLGSVDITGNIDFGSFRDLQRHRNAINVMPLLTPSLGFHEWYLDQLEDHPGGLYDRAQELVENIERYYDELKEVDETVKQYMLPMGFKVDYHFNCYWSELIYVASLRSSQTVHPTLREQIKYWVEITKEEFNINLPHVNTEDDAWNIRRGAQTILDKKQNA
jgi:thymidylate synthase ThyX